MRAAILVRSPRHPHRNPWQSLPAALLEPLPGGRSGIPPFVPKPGTVPGLAAPQLRPFSKASRSDRCEVATVVEVQDEAVPASPRAATGRTGLDPGPGSDAKERQQRTSADHSRSLDEVSLDMGGHSYSQGNDGQGRILPTAGRVGDCCWRYRDCRCRVRASRNPRSGPRIVGHSCRAHVMARDIHQVPEVRVQ